jgi:exodeoxyribonuclease VII small subunit
VSNDEARGDDADDAPLVGDDGKPLPFEDALEELESIVDRMEAGELGLEESVACFERGMRLHRHCQHALDAATQKVQVLVRRSEVAREGDLASFEPGSGDDSGDAR